MTAKWGISCHTGLRFSRCQSCFSVNDPKNGHLTVNRHYLEVDVGVVDLLIHLLSPLFNSCYFSDCSVLAPSALPPKTLGHIVISSYQLR